MRGGSLAVRLVAGAALWSAAALVAGGLILSAVFRDYVERSFDARLSVLLESMVAASEIDARGRVSVSRGLGEPRFEQPYAGWYWQIEGPGGVALRSRSLWDQVLRSDGSTPTDEGRGYQASGPEKQRLRVISRQIRFPDANLSLRYDVAGDVSEIEGEIRRFNSTLRWSLGALGLGLLTAMLIQVLYGLRPLRRISGALANIRSGRAERLEGRMPAEIAPLANELNALLEHNTQIVERARTHVGNLAHALKTPLSVLSNEAAGGGAFAETVRRQTTLMRRQVDHYLSRARAAGSGGLVSARTEVAGVIDDIHRTLLRIHVERTLEINVDCAPAAVFRGERQDLEEMVGNLMDNACKWARSRVRITAAVNAIRLTILVEDDGEGLALESRESVLERGRRLDEKMSGSGLGLSIVSDIAELYGGRLTLDDSDLGGVKAALDLPAVR